MSSRLSRSAADRGLWRLVRSRRSDTTAHFDLAHCWMSTVPADGGLALVSMTYTLVGLEISLTDASLGPALDPKLAQTEWWAEEVDEREIDLSCGRILINTVLPGADWSVSHVLFQTSYVLRTLCMQGLGACKYGPAAAAVAGPQWGV